MFCSLIVLSDNHRHLWSSFCSLQILLTYFLNRPPFFRKQQLSRRPASSSPSHTLRAGWLTTIIVAYASSEGNKQMSWRVWNYIVDLVVLIVVYDVALLLRERRKSVPLSLFFWIGWMDGWMDNKWKRNEFELFVGSKRFDTCRGGHISCSHIHEHAGGSK